MPPKQNPSAPLPNRPKRNRKPSLQAIEAAENKAAEEKWLAKRRKGKAKRQAQQAQTNPFNVSAPALASVPQQPLPPPPAALPALPVPVLPAGPQPPVLPHPQQTQTINQGMAQLVLQTPITIPRPLAPLAPPPPPALPSGPPPPVPQPLQQPPSVSVSARIVPQPQPHPALAPHPALVLPLTQSSVPPAALAQTRGQDVHRSYVDALQYERDSYNNLHDYFLVEQTMKVRTPVIRWDDMKPPTNEPIVPLSHEHEPPTPQFPHPDDIEPSKRSNHVFVSGASGANGAFGLQGGGLCGGDHAGAAASGDDDLPPPPAAKRRRNRKRPVSAFSKPPVATKRPPSQPKKAPTSVAAPVQLPSTSVIAPLLREHTLYMARKFGRIWKQEHAQKCAMLAMHADVPSFVSPYALKSPSIPSWNSFKADEPRNRGSQHDSLKSFLEHLLSLNVSHLPISSSDSALVAEGPTCGSSDLYLPELQLSSQMPIVMPPPPTPQLVSEHYFERDSPVDDNTSNSISPGSSSWWHPLEAAAPCGRETSCANVGCPRCYYMACPCVCHKDASNSFVSAGRDEPEDWVDFDTALTDVATGTEELPTNGNSERRAAAAAGMVPAIIPMFPAELFGRNEGGKLSPRSFDMDLAPYV
ncbi:hypothetical protein CMQ_3582 [Grosmannia clavigera kw1407]|uniref:Uncharacterized protein n=1 Tax=Grosmannia clavigera (strain kw1407 / UAMH 11150) TaxID=655863 RepID=F0X878_GROCL|nr:uncharacterized protein CMQ_3582 [Grosmannia clavigera kw1407]EFX05513.1 hypothetical protein CMQ_3582 [Grosmannia clavigera kw1407]